MNKQPKPKAKSEQPKLNAIGKPYSPTFDPNYKPRHQVSNAHLFKPYGMAMKLTKTA